MRKIILSLAMSLDGYILDEHGSYEWIRGDGDSRLDTEQAFDYGSFLKNIDVVVMGRVCYETDPMDFFKDKRVIVASRTDRTDHDNVEFVKDDIVGVVRTLQQEEGKDIFLYGGSLLVDHFMKADIIDEFVIAIIPMLVGKGKPLFLNHYPAVELHLDRYSVQEGTTVLEYSRRRK